MYVYVCKSGGAGIGFISIESLERVVVISIHFQDFHALYLLHI